METPVIEPPKKENKTWPIVGTIAAIVLCGLPGLCLLCPLGVITLAGWVNSSNLGFNLDLPQWSGAAFLCLAVVFIAIAVLVPVLTLRKKKPAEAAVEVPPNPQEPLPPAS